MIVGLALLVEFELSVTVRFGAIKLDSLTYVSVVPWINDLEYPPAPETPIPKETAPTTLVVVIDGVDAAVIEMLPPLAVTLELLT